MVLWVRELRLTTLAADHSTLMGGAACMEIDGSVGQGVEAYHPS
jgi:hypothetical protein